MDHWTDPYSMEGVDSCKLSYVINNEKSREPIGDRSIYLDFITAFDNDIGRKNLKTWKYDQNEPIKPDQTITLTPI